MLIICIHKRMNIFFVPFGYLIIKFKIFYIIIITVNCVKHRSSTLLLCFKIILWCFNYKSIIRGKYSRNYINLFMFQKIIIFYFFICKRIFFRKKINSAKRFIFFLKNMNIFFVPFWYFIFKQKIFIYMKFIIYYPKKLS